jgi:hypothetical protein
VEELVEVDRRHPGSVGERADTALTRR